MKRYLPSQRRLIQLYAAVLYNAHLKGFIKGELYTGKTKALCVPGLQCYSCPSSVGACPLGALQNALAASKNRAGFYVFGILILFGLMLGRTICGWICPFGLLQELIHKIPTPKLKKCRITRVLSYLKYVILLLFVLALPLWYAFRSGMAVPAFCKYICPAGTLEGAVSLLSHPRNADFFSMLGAIFTSKFVIMLGIILACIFCYRAFCRFLCPLGAIYGMFSKLALVGVRVDMDRCTHCNACIRSCEMDVQKIGDHECIHCGKCMRVCASNAISIKAGEITLKTNDHFNNPDKKNQEKRTKTIRIIWASALAVLIFALLWYSVLDPQAGNESSVSGYEEGEELQDFTITCMDGSEFRLSDHRGKVVFINLWATYCGPCVKELPYFDALRAEHPEDLTVLAVHHSMTVTDIPGYLSGHDWNHITFAVDTPEKLVWDITGAGDAMPQTIVLDREGRVIYNQVGSVKPELLEQLLKEASGQNE